MSNASRRPWAWVGVASFALFAFTAPRTVAFGDSGELIAAAASLGVAHPPGYPLYTVLGWLALKVPLGEPAFRMNLLSAAWGAVAAGLLAWWIERAAGSRAGALAAGLALALSSTFWEVSTVAEVYTLHLALTAALLAAAWRFGSTEEPVARGRALVAAAAALGLGLAHHPTIAVALPSAAVLGWAGIRRTVASRAVALAAAAATMIPLGAYASLLLRARLEPAANWGHPVTWEALLGHAGAFRYRVFDVGWSGLLRADAWVTLAGALWSEFAGLGLILAALGAVDRRPRAAGGQRLRAALALVAAASAAFALRYATEDNRVFHLPATLAVAALAGLGVAGMETRLSRRVGRIVAVALSALLVVVLGVAHFREQDRRADRGAEDYGRDLLASIPGDGIVFAEGDDAFVVAYLTQVKGERPDIVLYDRGGNLFRDVLRESGASPRPGESPADLRLRREIDMAVREGAAPGGRAVCFMSWPGYELPGGAVFEPVGLLYRVKRAGEPPTADGAMWGGYHEDSILREAERTRDLFATTVAAYYPLMRGERALYLDRRDDAVRSFDEAARVAGESETIRNALGTIFGRAGDYPRAIREFEEAVRIKPVSPRAWANLATARELAGDPRGADEARRRLETLVGR